MLILLPPSEGKAVPGRGRFLDLARLSAPGLSGAREQVLDSLVALCRADRDRAVQVLGLGPTQADDVARNARLREEPTARAEAIYTGVLYEALDLVSLDPAARRRASRRLAVTSAVFGLVRPGDRIPSYRLGGGVNLPGVGPVAAHWRAVLGPAVLEAAGTGLVVDLRSSTYAGFWRPGRELAPRVVAVRVLQQAGSRRTVVSHLNKATKGRLARALLEQGDTPATPAALADTLADLGWKVELGDPTSAGQPLEVVVEDL